MSRWHQVRKEDRTLDNILTRFQEKLASLKKQLEEETEKLRQKLQEQE